MNRSRRNVFLLASSQALMLSAIVMSMALGAVLGNTLAENKSLATLPIALMVIGTAIASVPASLLMQRFGRRAGFLIGATLCVAGSLTAALALPCCCLPCALRPVSSSGSGALQSSHNCFFHLPQ